MDEQSTPESKDLGFASYPFPKNLKVAVKQGCYRLHNAENDEFEDIEAMNAKDALTKTKFQKVGKILYLGFLDKTILTREDVLNDEKSAKVEEEAK